MLTDKNYFNSPEIWGGLECTINRVGETYIDQLSFSGHYQREDDIRKFAQLGIKALRYPVLWEYCERNNGLNWQWIEQQLIAIRENNIIPIAGLVHHGSGPLFTNLKDPLFACKLEAYAYSVASRFPWLEYYTPVNEPLTTARFSGLYGHWYPHSRDNKSFALMLVNQLKATVLAMNAIRKINPKAKLVQTEDLANVHSTRLLRYQADFENHRRWLTYDFLCGRMNSDHPLWHYFIDAGVPREELLFFVENPCVPDIMGLNYYVTSERYLDEKIDQYPVHLHGGNGRHRYADIEAVRKQHCRPTGLKRLVKETWDRYHLPIALTEVHLSCTREEQLRWFFQAWSAACALKKRGVNIRAVTAWSLLGAFNWDSLLTQKNNHYESGVFDISNNVLRETALAKLLYSLASAGNFSHPLLQQKGWWERNKKRNSNIKGTEKKPGNFNPPVSPVLIIGKTDALGNAFAKVCEQRAIDFNVLSKKEIDICDKKSICDAIDFYRPWAIINTAGYTWIDEAETEAELCFEMNARGPTALAKICHDKGIKFMTFSSDMVFDGLKKSPYFENDIVKPLNIYGKSKAHAEKTICAEAPSSLIIRPGAFFSPWDDLNFATNVLKNLTANKNMQVLKDVHISPAYIPDLVQASLDLMIDDEKGVWHLSNESQVTWSEFASDIAERGKLNKCLLRPVMLQEMRFKARRPAYSVLSSNRGVKLPLLCNALDRFFSENSVTNYDCR